jgi:DNA-binding protein, YbaB/EbfC family
MNGLGNLMDIMKNAKQMMEKAKEAQAELGKKTAEGQAGAGLVTVKMNGLGEVLEVKFDKSVVNPDDMELLSDLVVAAVADARQKSLKFRSELYENMAGGVDLSALGIDKSMLF